MWLFCLPPHSTRLLKPLDVGLFGPLQHYYGIGIDEHFRGHGESIGFAPQCFLPIYLEACQKAYSLANIESAFRATGIVPLNSRVLTKPRVEAQGEIESVLLGKTPYTKCQLRQQTNTALTFVKTVTPGKECNLILRFSHAVEQSFTTAEIANSEASRLRTQLREGSGQGGSLKKRKDRRVVSNTLVLTVGEEIAMVEKLDQSEMSAGRAARCLRRPLVTQTSGSGSLAIHATPRRARVRFEANVTPLSFELPHDTGFKLNPNDTENITFRINRALHSVGISNTRVERIRCTETRRILGVTSPTSTLRDLLQHRDMALKAARTVDISITDIVIQQKWMWTRIHNISLTRYMGREKDGGLRKLREELEAENVGIQIPAEIRWLGGAKARARFQEKKAGVSSVVAAVLGEASFNRLCRYGVKLLGVRHEVDAYEEVRPNAFCTRCSGWGRIAPHCSNADPKCSICTGDHEAINHRCPVEGRKVGKGRLCPHGTVKCANCGGPHGARADACAVKREARGEAKGWRSPSPKRREKGKGPEDPEKRTTATQGEEKGEAECPVPEEEGAAQAAMEVEE